MGVNNIKYGVRFNCVFVIYLIVVPCFSLDVEFLDCIHVFAFLVYIIYSHHPLRNVHRADPV